MGKPPKDPPSYWSAPKMWDGATVYVVGGGPSLKDMDWSKLHGRRAIGCNDAYRLGARVADVCYWGDFSWFLTHAKDHVYDKKSGEHFEGLTMYSGLVVTCNPDHKVGRYPWVKRLHRMARGIHEPPRVGWFCNTGISAINLAVQFGASRIVLLGFDMSLGRQGESNWHVNLKDRPNANVYKRFVKEAGHCASGMKEFAPDVEVIDANPDGGLDCWDKMPREEALAL